MGAAFSGRAVVRGSDAKTTYPPLPPVTSWIGMDEGGEPRAGGNALGGVNTALQRRLGESPPSDCLCQPCVFRMEWLRDEGNSLRSRGK